jgi:hypothetical protein
MQCMNCRKDVEEKDAKFFLKTFLCPACAEGGAKLLAKATSGLHNALATMEDLVRLVLTDSAYPFLPESMDRVPAEDALLFMLVAMKDKRKRDACSNNLTSSSKSTKPRALAADGRRSSNKPSPAD